MPIFPQRVVLAGIPVISMKILQGKMMDLNGSDRHILHQWKQGMFCQSDLSSTDLRVLQRRRLAATPLSIVLLSVLWINSECWSLWVDKKMFRIWCVAIRWSKKWRCVTIGRPDDRTSSSSSSQHAVLSIYCLFRTAGQRELIEDRSVGHPGTSAWRRLRCTSAYCSSTGTQRPCATAEPFIGVLLGHLHVAPRLKKHPVVGPFQLKYSFYMLRS